MAHESDRDPDERKTTRRRVSKPLAAAAVILAMGLVFITAIKIHATWLLAQAPTGWNQSQLAKIDRSRTKFKFAVFGDTHNSTKAFGRIKKEVEKGDYLFAIAVGDMSIDSGMVKVRKAAICACGIPLNTLSVP